MLGMRPFRGRTGSSVETLGFSTFELMFGRQVNGTLALVKKAWLNHSPSQTKSTKKSAIEFVQDIRERLPFSIMSDDKCAENAKRKSKFGTIRKRR